MEAKKTWIEVWTENYKGLSPIAQSIIIKPNFKGNTYIPWAVMERVMFQLDPESSAEPELNKDGGMVHSEVFALPTVDKNGNPSTTYAVSHFIKLVCKFMDKTIVENYPLQDNSYAAIRIFDQNNVNRAIQRGKAKVISRATGIGWGLYESGDLQYDLDGKEDKQAPTPQDIKPVSTKAKEKATDTPLPTINVVAAPAEPEADKPNYAALIHEMLHAVPEAKALGVLAFINKTFERSYKKTISLEDSVEKVAELVALVAKPEVLVKSIKTQLEVANA